jgi:hypothetical protein
MWWWMRTNRRSPSQRIVSPINSRIGPRRWFRVAAAWGIHHTPSAGSASGAYSGGNPTAVGRHRPDPGRPPQ